MNTLPDAWQGTGTCVFPQMGTLPWLKVAVPQTGKADEGVCPNELQAGCAKLWRYAKIPSIKKASLKYVLLISGFKYI